MVGGILVPVRDAETSLPPPGGGVAVLKASMLTRLWGNEGVLAALNTTDLHMPSLITKIIRILDMKCKST
jgi:hypothetical protein